MKINDIFSYAFSAVKLRKLRASLTTLGVIIGIAAIVALLSITQGLQNAISVQLQKGFATDTLIVTAGANFGMGGDSGFRLFVNDTQIIDQLNNVEISVAIIQRSGYAKVGEQTRLVTIVGVDFAAYKEIYSSTFMAESGTIPLIPENDAVVLGKRVSDPWKNGTLFCNVNDSIEILWVNATARPPRNETYTARVVAVLSEIGGLSFGGPSDFSVYIPLDQAQSFFGTNECNMIIVKLENDAKTTIESVTQAIKNAFSNQVTVTSSTAVLNIISNVFSTVELFLAGIAAISLLVAGIGIMNIMLVSLMERTREIGILKALGMKSKTVLTVFLCESTIIGLLGSVIGIILGWSLANVVVRILQTGGRSFIGNQAAATNGIAIAPILTPTVLVGAFVFGIGVSIIFALYPAWRASKLKPVEALRYE